MRSFSGCCAACFSEQTREKLIRTALRSIALPYSKNFSDRRTDREKGVLALGPQTQQAIRAYMEDHGYTSSSASPNQANGTDLAKQLLEPTRAPVAMPYQMKNLLNGKTRYKYDLS